MPGESALENPTEAPRKEPSMEREKPKTPEEVSLQRDEEEARRAIEQAAEKSGIELRPIAGAEPWLVKGSKELRKITSPDLRRMVALLDKTPDSLLALDRLEERYFQIQDLVARGKAEEEEATLFLDRITKRFEQIAEAAIEEEPEIEKILKHPETATPKEIVETVFAEIDKLEGKGTKEIKKFEQEYSEWTAIGRAIERIPPKTGKEDKELSAYLKQEYPKGVYLKEKLELLFEARRRLHNRKIEVMLANGDLIQLGATTPEVLKGLKIEVTDIRPMDWYVLFHMDEMFPESESPETTIDVAAAMKLWDEVGEAGEFLAETLMDAASDEEKKLTKKLQRAKRARKKAKLTKKEEKIKEKIPSFYNILNSDELLKDLRSRLVKHLGDTKAEELANDICQVTLRFDRWDKERKRIVGSKSQPRDVMHFEAKRRKEFYEKHGPAGPYDTVGCYWAEERQDEKKPKTKEDRERLKILKKNKGRAVFIYDLNQPAMGQIIGDFWETTNISVGKGTKKEPVGGKREWVDQYKRLSEVAKDRGWKEIDFLSLGEGVYAGYFTYSLAIAAAIVSDFNNRGWSPEKDGLTSVGFWEGKYRFINRITAFSPWFNQLSRSDKDQEWQETHLAKIRMVFARGILWDGSYLAQPEKGVFGFFTRRGSFSARQVNDIYRAIESSGYLPKEYLDHLKYEAREFNFVLRGG